MPVKTSDPWMKWYPSDWFGDTSLRMCSIGARGLWQDMRGFMHMSGVPYGHLATRRGEPLTLEKLAGLSGITVEQTLKLLEELEAQQVFARTGGGVIFDPKMVRAYEKREKMRNIASAGGKAMWQSIRRSDTPQQLVKQNALAEGAPHVDSGSMGSSGEGAGEDSCATVEPVIPTAAEVVAYGEMRMIPAEYCRDYHEKKHISRTWTVRGELIDWQREVAFRWTKDREKWKPSNPSSGGEDLDDLRSLLQGETDEQKRAAIRAKIERLTKR